jgi:hypothetical protein
MLGDLRKLLKQYTETSQGAGPPRVQHTCPVLDGQCGKWRETTGKRESRSPVTIVGTSANIQQDSKKLTRSGRVRCEA